jgi:hypothetical protein
MGAVVGTWKVVVNSPAAFEAIVLTFISTPDTV